MKKLLAAGVLGVLAAGLALAMLATADDGKGEIHSGGDGPLNFAVYGDAPYSNLDPPDYTKTPPDDPTQFNATPAFIDAVNADKKVKLVLNVGDIHSGKQPCTFAYDTAIYDLWTQFHDPLVYTPGDNEWTDCHKAKQGGNVVVNGNYIDYANGNPVANLGLVRQIFFSQPGEALGHEHKEVLSQAQAFDPNHPTDAEYVENVMWEQAGVLFVTVNIPGGSDNDTDAWYGAAVTGEQLQEQAERTAADIRWLDAAFARATADGAAGVVIVTQADMWDLDSKTLAAMHLVHLEPIINEIASLTTVFGNPVLLFNGDSHIYRSDNPLVDNSTCRTESDPCATTAISLGDAFDTHPNLIGLHVTNFHRVVVHGSTQPFEYLRVSVDVEHPPAAGPNSFGPFSWERVQP